MCGWQLFGVSWNKKSGVWEVRLCIPGEKPFIKSFADEVAAGKKYDALVSALHRGHW